MAIGNNPGLKKAYQEMEYTPDMIREFAICQKDPVHFIRKWVKIQHPVRGEVPFNLYPYQEEMVRAFADNRLVVTLMSRQSGKTQTAACYLLWHGMYNEDQTILIASNKNSNAKEIIQRIQYIYERLPDWLKPGLVSYTKHSLEFDNGTRILSQATTENTGRGLSISKLFLDEMAFVPHSIQEELWTSLSPTLATGGSLIIASTPNGDTDIFSQIWRGANTFIGEDDECGVNGFKPLKVLWHSVPGRDEKFKQQEMAKIGEIKFRQEYDCEFISSDPLLIDSILLNRLSDEAMHFKPVGHVADVRLFEMPISGATYILGVDPATGSGSDYTTFVGFRFPEMVQVLEYRSNIMSSSESYKTLRSLLKYYERAKAEVYFSVENNGVGEGIMTLIEHDEGGIDTSIFVSEEGKNRMGFTTTASAKLRSCITLKEMVERGQIKIKSSMLIHEMKHFVRTKGSYDHQIGATSDLISATLIALRILNEMSTYDERAYEKLYSLDGNDELVEFEEDTEYNPGDYLLF